VSTTMLSLTLFVTLLENGLIMTGKTSLL